MRLADLSSAGQDASIPVAVKQLRSDDIIDVRVHVALVSSLPCYRVKVVSSERLSSETRSRNEDLERAGPSEHPSIYRLSS